MGRRKIRSDRDLLAAAKAVFLRFGHGASTRDIADAAGMSQAALFQRFGDKSGLFAAAMLPDPLDAEQILGQTRGGSLEALEAIALRLLDAMHSRLPLIAAVSAHPTIEAEVIDRAHRQLGAKELVVALTRRFAEWRSENGLPTHLEPHLLTEAVFLAVHGALMMGTRQSGHVDKHARALVSRFVTLIWR
jgi:AcrR family transcriptional regulator